MRSAAAPSSTRSWRWCLVLVVMLCGRGVLANFPMAALGALVVYAALRLVDVPEFKRLGRFRRSELILALATTAAVLVFGVLYGVLVAIVLSILDLLRRVARPHDAVQGFVPGVAGMHDIDDYPEADLEPGLLVYRYDAPLFFANAENFRERALAAVDEYPGAVEWFVLNAEANVEVDLTALDALDQLRAELERRGIVFAMARVKQDSARRTRGRGLARQDRRGPHLHDSADGGRGLPHSPHPVGHAAAIYEQRPVERFHDDQQSELVPVGSLPSMAYHHLHRSIKFAADAARAGWRGSTKMVHEHDVLLESNATA